MCKYKKEEGKRESVCFMCVHLNICASMHVHSRENKLKRKYRSQVYKGKKKIASLGKLTCLYE